MIQIIPGFIAVNVLETEWVADSLRMIVSRYPTIVHRRCPPRTYRTDVDSLRGLECVPVLERRPRSTGTR